MANLLKANANTLHEFLVTNLSKDVTFTFNHQNLEIIVENLKVSGLKLIIKMHKHALDVPVNESITWNYLADPKDKNSEVNRKSSIQTIGAHIVEIVEKKMFDKTYLAELEGPTQ